MPPSADSTPTTAGLRFGLYDWATSPVFALHTTFIFPVYFTTAIMPDGGSGAWAWLNSGAAMAVAILAPILGAAADRFALHKTLLALITGVVCLGLFSLWWAKPDPSFALFALLISALIIIASELAFVTYNALLPQSTPAQNLGRTSGVAWGIGYFGAILCLILILAIFILPDSPPFGLDKALAEHIRITMPLAGLWCAVFAVPFFLLLPKTNSSRQCNQPFLAGLKASLHLAISIPGLVRFLIARMFFNDGLITLFALGGIFAAKIHGFDTSSVLIFAIILNITAGIGACLGGVLDDRIGSLKVIRIFLGIMITIGLMAIVTPSVAVFWIAGSLLGVCVGPLQASARSHIARLTPEGAEGRMFGLMILTGKATAFLGPALYGVIVMLTASDRMAMGVVLVLLGTGLVLLPRSPQ